MQNLSAIAYISTAVEPSTAKIESILSDARQYNLEHGISGVLLYSKGTFLQYFEGGAGEMGPVYERIKGAKSHTNIKPLLMADIGQRAFSTWEMGCAQITESEMLALSTAHWIACEKTFDNQALASPGVSLLKTFWLAARI